MKIKSAVSLLALLFLIPFQNCGQGFQSVTSGLTASTPSEDSSEAYPHLPDADPALGPFAKTTYTESNENIPNPERGFFWMRDCRSNPFTATQLLQYRKEGKAVVHCMWYLKDFKTSNISSSVLNLLQVQLETIRGAGFKVVFRFAYTDSGTDDAAVMQVLSHLDQLRPYLQSNKDVIMNIQAGFIGQWGEWADSDHFGNINALTTQNWADRKSVLDKLLQVLPVERTISVRTPEFKRHEYGTSPLTSVEAFQGSDRARIGQHNDCFLASNDDGGTYTDTTIEEPWLEAETKFLPMGGETCDVNPPRSTCENAQLEMARFHWSHLNAGYNLDVYDQWKNEGCFNLIEKHLGYRFVLRNGSFTASAQAGGRMSVIFSVVNRGYAAPFGPRGLEIVLRNNATGALRRLPLSQDPRLWLPGETVIVNQVLTLPPDLAVGTYSVLLNLPDPEMTLQTRAEYSIQTANTNLWEATTGFNKLNHTLLITP